MPLVTDAKQQQFLDCLFGFLPLLVIEIAALVERRDLMLEIGVMLSGCPDGEKQVLGADRANLAGRKPHLEGKKAGRDMSNYKVMSAAPAYFGTREECIAATRWFPAMVGNHVADIVEKYGTERDDIPPALTAYIKDRKGYDYSKHGQSDNPYLDFITDEIIEGFSVLGPAEQQVAKLNVLKDAGVTQFNIYLDNGKEEQIIAEYGEKIIPAFTA